jgi:predicted permease
VAAAIPLFGAFVVGLGVRRWLQRHISLLFRMQLAGGIGVLSVLAGWSFDVSVRNVAAIAVLLAAQLTSVSVAARLFRGRTDGPLLSFWMYGNPTFWTAPVAAATLGAEAAVFVIAFDMLTQARIAVGVKYLRRRAPKSQSSRTALADYAPSIGAVAGLAVGGVITAPDVVDTLVAGLGIVMAGVGFLLLGVSWPKRWIGRPQVLMTLRGLSLSYTIVPSILGLATLAGVDLPGAVWLLAFGPIPTSVVSFAQVYGYSPKTAATGLTISIACAIVLLPLSLTLAGL